MSSGLLRTGALWPLYVLIFAVWFMFLATRNTVDMDLWGLLSFGELFYKTFPDFPARDVFSYTAPDAPWIYHEWLSGVLFHTLFHHFGSGSLYALKLLIIATTAWLVYKTLKLNTRNLNDGPIWLFLFTLPVSLYLVLPPLLSTLRCHLFTFLGFAFLLWCLEKLRVEEKPTPLWCFPLAFLVWSNLHGGYVVAFAPLGVYAVWMLLQKRRPALRQLGIVTFLCLAGMFVNPYGAALPLELVSAWFHPRARITEWGSVMDWNMTYGGWVSLLLLVWVYVAVTGWLNDKRRFPAVEILLLAFGVEGFLHMKLLPLFLILLLSLGFTLPTGSQSLPLNPWLLRPLQVLCLLAAGGVLYVSAMYFSAAGLAVQVPGGRNRDVPIRYPQGAVEFIREYDIRGNLWSTFEWGEYLMWTVYPQVRISVDGRYETVYPESVFEHHHGFFQPPHQLENAFRYPTELVLVPLSQKNLLDKLVASGKLHAIYADEIAVLFSTRMSDPIQVNGNPNPMRPLDAYRR